MIVLDTHIWVWWVHGDERLSKAQIEALQVSEDDVIGVSAISCWKLRSWLKGVDLNCPVLFLIGLNKLSLILESEFLN